MDIQVLMTSIATFCLFLGATAILFRLTRQEDAIVWIMRSWVGVGVVVWICFVRVWGPEEVLFWVSVYGLLTALFVFGIFSNMEASLTLRILTEIATKRGGITGPQILKKYNRTVIVKRRIERLVYTGELTKTGSMYVLGRISYFRLREYFLDIFRLAFG